MMTKLSLLVISIGLTILSCTKKELTDLEYNKWEQDIPHTIVLDSITANAIDPSTGNATFHITFDQSELEQSWDKINRIRIIYERGGLFPSSTLVGSVPFSNGKGNLSISTKNNSPYTFKLFIEFNNGRTTERTQEYNFVTPPF